MTTLAQIIAVRSGIKQGALRSLTDLYNNLKPDQLSGLHRTYQARDEDGEVLPSEEKVLQTTVPRQLGAVSAQLGRFWDVTATNEYGNLEARADIVIDGKVLLAAVPVTMLLFLEKQAQDWKTACSALPLLDPGERWHWDDATNCFVSAPARTQRTRKVLRNHVKAEATDKHPAQVEIYTEDEGIGTWTRTSFSGGLPARTRADLVECSQQLLEAVKMARESANAVTVADQRISKTLLDYLLSPL